MVFYQSIVDHYDDIFPLNAAQMEFVEGIVGTGDYHLLDVGCGTGSLCIALAPNYGHITGIDPDNAMIEKAREKAVGHQNLSFEKYGMLDLEKQYRLQSFDAVLCFGNTLVHLSSEKEIGEFLRQAKKVLKPGGELLIQVINYDRIFSQGIKGLPTIENDRIKFVRNYHWVEDGEPVDFETILSVKSTGQEIRNNIKLFPVRKKELEEMLVLAGFTNIKFSGNFKRDALQKESTPLVIEARSAGPML